MIFLAACGPTEEEVAEMVQENLAGYFEMEPNEPNVELTEFSLHIPETFEIVEESDSNLILEQDDRLYVLFYNTFESKDSDFFYRSLKEMNQYVLLESYEDKDRFGFSMLTDVEETYEFQAGVGGVRITTHGELEEVEEQFETMISILNSIESVEETLAD